MALPNANDSLAEIARLRAELDAAKAREAELRAKATRSQPFKLVVSEKGALSAYGVGRWPVTLYATQWRVILDHAPAIMAILTAGSGTDKAGVKRALAIKGE